MADPAGAESITPGDQIRLIMALLRPMGLEHARRWLVALTFVPEEDRASVIDAVESSIIAEYVDHPDRVGN